MTFNGLCANHDNILFKSIEREELDFADYKSLLLLTYRPILHEYRLKEAVSEVFQKLESHPVVGDEVDPIGIHVLKEAQNIMLWDLEYLILCLQKDLESDTKHFKFCSISLPRLEVCTSIVFSYKSLADSFKTFPEIDYKQKEPIANIFLHLIPCLYETKLVLGYLLESEKHIKPRIDYLKELSQTKLLKELSDILIKSCETWACSERFYEKQIRNRELEVLRLMNYFIHSKQFSKEPIELNLFDSII